MASPADAEHVTRLMLLFRDWWKRDWPDDATWARNVERLLSDDSTDFLLGSLDGEAASGVVALRYRFSLWQDALDCCLEDLYVEERARRYGLGEQLARAALERARERGCRRIELDVNEANAPALHLYEKLSFSAFSPELGGNNLMMRRYLTGVG